MNNGTEFGNAFSKFLYGSDTKNAVKVLINDHRSLQQAAMRFCMTFIEEMANNSSDLRNEASVKLAQEIMKLPAQIRALPRI